LGSVAKYPALSSSLIKPPGVAGKKFNFFHAEKELFAEVAANCGLIEYAPYSYARHPLAYLVEAADDIAYLAVDFEDGARLGMISQEEVESRYLSLLPDPAAASHLRDIANPVRRTEYLRALVIGALVRETAQVFCRHCDEILSGGLGQPLTELLSCTPQLKELRARSVELIYNHRKVAEIIGAGFEMVSGMLDIFVPSVSELAAEKLGGPAASYRSRRMGAMVLGISEYLNDSAWCADPYLQLLTVMDFISGMTDSYAVSIYRKLKGITL
jgi:dGTPase